MKSTLLVATLFASLLAHGAYAACTRDPAPVIPDGTKATDEDMTAGQQAIKTYLASTNAYLECLDAEGAAAGKEETAEAKSARVGNYNAAVDEMNDVAARFNEAVKAFKAKS